MPEKNLGPKGQVVIPKAMRETIGLKPGAEISLELRQDEIVITKPKIKGKYTEYYSSTRSSKLRKQVNIKELLAEETCNRHVIP